MTPKQAAFVDEYLVDMNATQAAIRAGYSAKTAGWIGNQLIVKTHISKAITDRMAERSQRTEITQDRVLLELSRLAFLDIRKAFDATGNLKEVCELDDNTAAAISGIEVLETVGESGLTTRLKKIKFSDKRASLDLAGRHLGMWNDKLALMNKDGSPLLQNLTVNLVKANGGD